ncbi:tyrosine-type recombinase/integrase [Amycolatopsis keratiniphila]|uniref:tyrosine-type recombinase/integrase n=1 Tax=Amycolatopsis keratiniphila TaxID=129921 RepID=UPI0009F9BA50|nr:tyrosine-type recombinase/integrase [Amycolatopsis keratiniphila]
MPWLVVDGNGQPVEPIRRFLTDFVARDNRTGSIRSYAYVLLRWWRWLRVVEVEWDHATSEETRDLVLWLQQAPKERVSARTISAATAGKVNPRTRKQYLDDRYKPRTIRHSNAVLRSFYEFWLETGEGPVINPVPLARPGRRAHAHHNPLERHTAEGRIRYNPRLPKRRPREMPDEGWNSFFAGLRSDRDRAIVSLAVSNGARAAELLGVCGADLNWGEQLVRVVRKGTGAEQWLPASPDAFMWIRLYLAALGETPGLREPLWWTLRRRDRGDGLRRHPLNYEALRAVFRRVNALLETNWTMHDLRHTAALRMARDQHLTLKDVQVILGHAHLSTTADVYLWEEDEAVVRRVATHLADRQHRPEQPAEPLALGYDSSDLSVLFGGFQP